MAGQLVVTLTVAFDPEDHETVDFLTGLAERGMTTRIEGDGDDLVTIDVLDVS